MRKLVLPTCNQVDAMITQDAFTIGKIAIKTVISKMTGLSMSQSKFIVRILLLFLCIRGRHNFLQMSREGSLNEKSYRAQFDKKFDWLTFNIELVKEHSSRDIILGFDPSFINKSGKHSHGIGYFYSGCQGAYKRGLELGSFAALDVNQHLAYHLVADQSPSAKRDRIGESKTLVDHYAEIVLERSEKLKELSDVLVFDAYFTKKKFVDVVSNQAGFEMIGRMRDDANLKYLYKGKQNKHRGRPKKYDGKIDTKNIDKRRLKLVCANDSQKIYTGVVYSVGLKRNIRVVFVEHSLKQKAIKKIYFSTNIERGAEKLLAYYRLRFQMEYIFRDSKQHMGLEHCQARSKNKLNFHHNASMTAVSLAKVIARNSAEKTSRMSISVADVKTELQNRNLINRILSIYRIDRKLIKINSAYRKLLNFGKVAA